MEKIFILVLIAIFCLSCEKIGETKGYFIDDDTYEVIAYGMANPNAKEDYIKRYQAKSAALLVAQKKVADTFDLKEAKSGLVVNLEYIDDSTCKLTYRLNIKNLKTHLKQK